MENQIEFNEKLIQQCKDAEPLVKLQNEKVAEVSISLIKKHLISNGFKDAKINLQIFPFNSDNDTTKKEGRISTSKGVMYYYTDYILN